MLADDLRELADRLEASGIAQDGIQCEVSIFGVRTQMELDRAMTLGDDRPFHDNSDGVYWTKTHLGVIETTAFHPRTLDGTAAKETAKE